MRWLVAFISTVILCAAAIAEVPGPAAVEPPANAVEPGRQPERVVFSSDRAGEWRIWVLDTDGSQAAQLTRGTPDDSDVDPVFSPDASRILFTSTRGGATGIWVMARDGTDLNRICEGDQAEWSPDAAKIVFRRDGRILTRDLGTGEEKTITPEGWTLCSGPAWCPDGTSIAFACRWDAGNSVFTVQPEGGEPTKVYGEEGACEPHWSPDGQTIVYETETHIRTIKRDGTGNRLVTYFGGLQRYARWSPDGTRLVFCQGVSERGPWELYTIPSDGGAPVQLTEGGSDMYPDWK